jgi:hypothetical protein
LGIGSISTYLGVISLLWDPYEKSIMVSNQNYNQLGGRISPIPELNQNLEEGESRYPVIISGAVHCGDSIESGKPFPSLYGPDCCFQRIYKIKSHDLNLISENYQDLYIKDDFFHEKIFVPRETIHVDIPTNIDLLKVTNDEDTFEMLIPYKAPIFAVGKVRKSGNRLYLTPEETVDQSLYLSISYNPVLFFNKISTAIKLFRTLGFISFTIGLLFLGYGGNSFYRKRLKRS